MPDASEPRSTWFLPAERADRPTIDAQRALVLSEVTVRQVLDAFPEPAVILNENRQIILTNPRMELLAGCSGDELVGARIGEALRCEHSAEGPNGCGTTRFCRNCGAAKATFRCLARREPGAEECRILREPGASLPALDLLVWATPIHVGGHRFMVFTARDTTDEKRRSVLERIFFHDVLNAAGGLRGVVDLLPESDPGEQLELCEMAARLSSQLVEEIEAQRDLASAECGELQVELDELDAGKLLSSVSDWYARHPAAAGKRIVIGDTLGETLIVSDERMLRRVLGNLVKNALEASDEGETVRISFENDVAPCFSVHNPAVIPDAVRDQIFQRSFTTKPGTGRGIGTYSIKLLTERYLGGSVSLSTERGYGTTFTVSLPGQRSGA